MLLFVPAKLLQHDFRWHLYTDHDVCLLRETIIVVDDQHLTSTELTFIINQGFYRGAGERCSPPPLSWSKYNICIFIYIEILNSGSFIA